VQRTRHAAFSTARRSGDPASGTLVVPRSRPFLALQPSDNETPEPPSLPSRQRGQLLWFEAPSVNKCSLVAFAERARHHSHSFATTSWLPTFLHSSLCSRTRRARPSTVVTGYSPVIVRTTRCLLTSAIVTIPRAQPLDRPNPACAGDRSPSSGPRPTEDSQVRGWRGGPTSSLSTSAIARRGSFSPTGSARTPPVADLLRSEAGVATAEDELSF